MTTDNCLVVDLPDVANIQFECKKCRARFVTPIAAWRDIPRSCPNCRESWGNPQGNIQRHVELLRDCLQLLAKVNGDSDSEFLIRFEVRQP
jgi:hypothetical protein